MTRHHPDTFRLMEFSAGSLSDPQALCIRLHLDQCTLCRSRGDTLDSLGAIMMEQQPEVSLSHSVFDNILDRIEEIPTLPLSEAAGRTDVLTSILGTSLSSIPWKRQLKDISVCDITQRFTDQRHRVVLQKLNAGGKAPAHTHRGEEFTIVLQGAYSDHKGVFHQGDFVVLDSQDNHRPVAVGNEDCITLSVLTAPLRLTGTFTRLLNPFIR